MMSAGLTPENERFINEQIAVGAFQDQYAAVNAGIDLLRRKKALLERLDEGRRQLDAGEFNEYDEALLAELFSRLVKRGHSQPIALS